MISALGHVERILAYDFLDKALLMQALTHSSASKNNNERLEFLGDSILNFAVGNYLFHKFPEAQEGQLSRMRASLVKGEALAELAKVFRLSEFIVVGPGEIRVAGNYRDSILAGTVEALIGAVYMDSDFATCQRCVLRWYGDTLTMISLEQQHVDAKTQLQELLQARRLALPKYIVIEKSGEAHCQFFTIECHVEALNECTQAQGNNRRQAEQTAAALMIERIQNGH